MVGVDEASCSSGRGPLRLWLKRRSDLSELGESSFEWSSTNSHEGSPKQPILATPLSDGWRKLGVAPTRGRQQVLGLELELVLP